MARQDRAIATRRTLVASAGDVFARLHYAEAKLSDVISAAGVSQGALYFHFTSKHDVAIAVIEAQLEMMQSTREAVLLSARDPLDALRLTVRSVAELTAGSRIVQGGVRLLVQSGREFPEVKVDPYGLWLAFASDRIREAKEQNLLAEGVVVEDAAWLFVSAFMGVKEIVAYRDDWSQLVPLATRNADFILSSLTI